MANHMLAEMADRAIEAREASEERARRKALRNVAEGLIEFHTTVGPSGGFTYVNGVPLVKPALLIALWDYRIRGLIAVQGQKVTLTASGKAPLAAWDGEPPAEPAAQPTGRRASGCPCEDDPYYGCDGAWCAGS